MATPLVYRASLAAAFNKEWDWDGDTFTAMLLDNTYAFNQNTHVFVDDVDGDEISGGSYARVALSGKSIGTATDGVVKLIADDIVFASMTATNVNYVVVFHNTGSDATSKLLCCIQFDAAENPTAQPVNIDLSTNGLVTLTV